MMIVSIEYTGDCGHCGYALSRRARLHMLAHLRGTHCQRTCMLSLILDFSDND